MEKYWVITDDMFDCGHVAHGPYDTLAEAQSEIESSLRRSSWNEWVAITKEVSSEFTV